MSGATDFYDVSVFINCPFKGNYKRIFDAIVFTILDCGFIPRCSLEAENVPFRLPRIIEIIRESRFAIHDLSRAGIDRKSGLARFNMPLELGIFLGAKEFGNRKQARKTFMILDKEKYRYQIFISDLNGIDPKPHNNDPKQAINKVRNWLNDFTNVNFAIPGGSVICERYKDFRSNLPDLAKSVKLHVNNLTFRDYCCLVQEWLKKVAP